MELERSGSDTGVMDKIEVIDSNEISEARELAIAALQTQVDAVVEDKPKEIRANGVRVLAIARAAGKPVTLGEITYGIFGQDTPKLRGRTSFHVRRLVDKGELDTIGPRTKPQYVLSGTKSRSKSEAKRVNVQKGLPMDALNVGDLFEYIGLSSDGSMVVRQVESIRLYKITAV